MKHHPTLEPYWKEKVQLHFLDTDWLVFSFDTNEKGLMNFLQQNKEDFELSDLVKYHALYNPLDEQVSGKRTAFESNLCSFSYTSNNQKTEQKGIQKTPECEEYITSFFMSETTSAKICTIRSSLHR